MKVLSRTVLLLNDYLRIDSVEIIYYGKQDGYRVMHILSSSYGQECNEDLEVVMEN